MKNSWSPGTALSRIRAILNATSIDRATDETTCFLISSGRSGSTWLMEVLKSVDRTRVVFEPFHPQRGIPTLIPERFSYLPPDVEQPALHTVLRQIIDGKTRSAWTEHHNQVSTWVYRRRLIKLVRATLMLPWLASQFPGCKFIYLVRHPAAVVQSQRHGGWNLRPDNLLKQAPLRQAIDVGPYESFRCSEPGFEANLIFWAIENQVAAEFARRSQCLMLRYEDLCMTPDTELSMIEDFLGVRFGDDLQDALSVSSWSSDRGVGGQSVDEKINKWHSRATAEQLNLVRRVVNASLLADLYPDADRPFDRDRSGAEIS